MTGPDAPRPGGLAATLVLYTLARVGLLALIAGILALAGTPLVIALLVALVVALPLSMLLFRGMRGRLDAALAASRERRGTQRAALRAGLRGDPVTASGERPDREPDGRGNRPDEQQHAVLREHADEPAAVRAAEHPPGDGHGQR